ncbi:DinB family protein [Psychrobacillus vulpis]|uniref:DinB family protein n=1 Tax=Psychrobacillus vulpis TaxID=2325572 RepID=A0A544TVU2_9BACI|nr:DinB family protein [Psychrobacillus vulpis]TQR21567.1 DinB family protein [Psychrobacillus vulpis]
MIKETIAQLQFVANTIESLLDHIDENFLHNRPIPDKMSVWEVCVHLSQIPQGDLHILKGYSEQQMTLYYDSTLPKDIKNVKVQFTTGIRELIQHIETLTEEQLTNKFTTYWGSEYNSAEWFIQIVNHLVHHRAQLYQYLLFLNRDVQIVLFR